MALWLISDETDPSHSKGLWPITLRIAHLRIAPWWAILRWAILSISFIRIAHPNHYVFFRLIWPLGECWGPRLCMPPKYYDAIIIFLRNITIVIFFIFDVFYDHTMHGFAPNPSPFPAEMPMRWEKTRHWWNIYKSELLWSHRVVTYWTYCKGYFLLIKMVTKAK